MAILTSHNTDEWGTPAYLIDRVRLFFGGNIEIDPAAPLDQSLWFATKRNWTIESDGLAAGHYWDGNTYLNAPYSLQKEFNNKLIEEWETGRMPTCISLNKCYLGYKWFSQLMDSANAVCWIRERLQFIPLAGQPVGADGRAKFGSVLFYWGKDIYLFKQSFSDLGWVTELR